MIKITVISGKGGTGKTTVVSNLAALADNPVLTDCDVDAPNMHLLLKPVVERSINFEGAKIAVKDESKCTDCGLCQKVCRFGAITPEYEVNAFKCDGCSVCAAMCPEDALKMVKQETGKIFISKSKFGPMIHARLYAGAENSGKLVSEVRDIADKIAEEEDRQLVLIDGSPGIGCPVIASLKDTDFALIVTEPTKSGISDLKRILEVTRHFTIPSMVVINKYDLNEDLVEEIKKFCSGIDIPVIGKIPFSSVVNEVLRDGQLLVQTRKNSKAAEAIRNIWQQVNNHITAKTIK